MPKRDLEAVVVASRMAKRDATSVHGEDGQLALP